MYASNKLNPGPQTEARRVGATTRAYNPTEEVILTEEYRVDVTAYVVADTAHVRDAEYSKAATTTTDEGEAMELMKV